MEELAAAILNKYYIQHTNLVPLGGGTNTSWHVQDTDIVVRVAADSVHNNTLQTGLEVAEKLVRAGVRFVNPAFPLVIQTETHKGLTARGTLWFYEAATGEPTNYRQLGELVRALQEVGSETIRGSVQGIPQAMRTADLEQLLEGLADAGKMEQYTYTLLHNWLPRIQRGAEKIGDFKPVLVHDDLWAKNTIMTANRGLTLCDPDNFAWGPPSYDLAFISRGREAGVISREEVRAFEEGYRGRIPDINTAWRMAMFHRFRWVCHLIERKDSDPAIKKRLREELALWRTKRGPQPG